MRTKKKYIYLNENEGVIGYCDIPADNKGGDNIIIDGVQCSVYAVFHGSEMNILLVRGLIKTIEERYTETVDGKKSLKDCDIIFDMIDRVVMDYMN